MIQQLADARLITTDVQTSEVLRSTPEAERGGAETSEVSKATVTLAHEKLIEAWPWLRKLVNENRDAIELQNQIAEDAQEWERNGRDASYLYTGARLAHAREQLAAKKIVLSRLAQEFVDKGIKAIETARRRRQWLIRAVISGLVIISLIFATLAVVAVQQSRLSHSRELAAVAANQINVDPERAILIALQANDDATTFEAQDALRVALFANHFQSVLRGHEEVVWSAQFSPDGQYVVTASDDRTARIYVTRPEDLMALAKTRVTRELTCEERMLYLHEVVCPTPAPAATAQP